MKNLLLAAACFFLLSSCQSDPPVIDQAAWYMEFSSLPGSEEEFVYLHISADIDEPQGFGDILEIRASAPKYIYWDIDVSQVNRRQEGRMITLATGRLEPPSPEEGFPAGTYRLTVTDIPGNSDVKELFVPRSSGELQSRPRPDASRVLMYDRRGMLIQSHPLDQQIEALIDQFDPEFYFLIAEDPEYPVIFSHGPVYP